MRRRSLLAALLPLVAGCAGTTDTSGSVPSGSGDGAAPSSDIGVSATRTPTDEPLPNLPAFDGDCAVTDLPAGDYPSLPDSLTESAASRFALDHERTYAAGELASSPGVTVGGVDGTESDVAETTKEGVLVRIRISLDYTHGEGTATAAASAVSRAWYYVSERFAVRAHDDGADAVPERGWHRVACAGE